MLAIGLDGDEVAELVATAAGTDQLALFTRATTEPLAYADPVLLNVGAAPSALAAMMLAPIKDVRRITSPSRAVIACAIVPNVGS